MRLVIEWKERGSRSWVGTMERAVILGWRERLRGRESVESWSGSGGGKGKGEIVTRVGECRKLEKRLFRHRSVFWVVEIVENSDV